MSKKIAVKSTPAKSIPAKRPLTKSQLVTILADEVGTGVTPATVKAILDAQMMIAMDNILQGRDFNVPGVVRLKIRSTAAKPARQGRNPSTGKEMTILAKPAGRKIVARAYSALRNLVAC